jgi:hypothetical protein
MQEFIIGINRALSTREVAETTDNRFSSRKHLFIELELIDEILDETVSNVIFIDFPRKESFQSNNNISALINKSVMELETICRKETKKNIWNGSFTVFLMRDSNQFSV